MQWKWTLENFSRQTHTNSDCIPTYIEYYPSFTKFIMSNRVYHCGRMEIFWFSWMYGLLVHTQYSYSTMACLTLGLYPAGRRSRLYKIYDVKWSTFDPRWIIENLLWTMVPISFIWKSYSKYSSLLDPVSQIRFGMSQVSREKRLRNASNWPILGSGSAVASSKDD